MAKTIIFIKEDEINGHLYKKGDEVKVHDTIADEKISNGVAKEKIQKKKVENGN